MIGVVVGFFVLLLLFGLFACLYALYRSQVAASSRMRLERMAHDLRNPEEAPPTVLAPPRRSSVLRRYGWIGIPLSLLVSAGLWFTFSIPWVYLAAIGLMILMLVFQIDSIFLQRRIERVEQQMADSIDMMVAGVKSGASLQSALESSAEQSERTWRTEINQVVRMIRYGDDPVHALTDLAERLPLESVVLFAQTLAVNWRVGGRLAVTLANVGRTIRDRIELSRRMVAMTTQARLSVISVIAVTYFIGALMWRNDPERMAGFLTSIVGQWLVSTAMVLQSVGMVWVAWISKPRF